MLDIQILPFLAASILIIVVPGPATLYITGEAHRSAWGAGYGTLGIIIGDVILMSFSAAGFAALVTRWPILLLGIKVVGALYVIYLGYALVTAAPAETEQALQPSGIRHIHSRIFLKGMLITLTNPKPILFFAAFFPLFIGTHSYSWSTSFYALGVLFELVNLGYFLCLIVIVAKLRRLATLTHHWPITIHQVSGTGLLLFGIAIFVATIWRIHQ